MTPSRSPGTTPRVSVVSVNFNGAHHLPRLLAGLEKQTFRDFEVLVVDNGSSDGSRSLLRERYPWVRCIEAPSNGGFVGGNNLGFHEARGELFALLNNDAIPDPAWLAALVEEMDRHPEVAVVGSKIVFARAFLSVGLATRPTYSPARAGHSADSRELGAFFAEDSHFDGCSYRKAVYASGFYGAEKGAGGRSWRWTEAKAVVYLPVESTQRAARLRLRLTGGVPSPRRRTEVTVGGEVVASLELDGQIREHVIEVPADLVARRSFDVINNAGSLLGEDATSGDRGIYEPDCGQYDAAEDMQAFCGCSALVRRGALDTVGSFDRDLFMYFEDTELSWRLRRAGYRLRYQPASRVRHVHAATSVEWSPMFNFLVARNRILMLARHAKLRHAVGAYLQELAHLLRFVHRHRSPSAQVVRTRLRIQLSLARRLPRMLLKRWGILREPGPERP